MLDLAHVAIQNGPDVREIERLAKLMRAIEANERERIQAVAGRFAA